LHLARFYPHLVELKLAQQVAKEAGVSESFIPT